MASQKKRRIPGWVKALAIILVVMVGLPSGYYAYEKRKAVEDQQEMISLVHSQEVKKVIEDGLRNLDPHALDGKGVIKTYYIDDSSIKHNPMGGYDFNTIVNNDRKLDVGFGIDRHYITGEGYGPIVAEDCSPSVELADLLDKRYGKGWSDTDNAAEKYRKAHPEEFPAPRKSRSDEPGKKEK